MQPAIQTRNLTKTFPGGTVAVSGLDLEIQPGTVFGLLGRNGAGKTTAMRLLMGLLRPDQGEALVLGETMWKAGRAVRSRISYLSQTQQLPGWMDFRDLCRYASSFYSHWNAPFAQDLARKWEISTNRPLATLSGGEQRKAALAIALAPEPDVLILDEPAAGLDPLSRRELINEVIGMLARNTSATILFSTHIISDLERVAQDIGILERGRLMLNRPLEQLQACYRRVQVIFPGDTAPPRFTIQGAARCRVAGPVVTGVTEYFDLEHIEALKRWPGVRVQVFPLSLEEVFIEVCGSRQESDPELPILETEMDPESKTVFSI